MHLDDADQELADDGQGKHSIGDGVSASVPHTLWMRRMAISMACQSQKITKLKVDGLLKEGSLQHIVSSSSSAEDMGTLRFSVSEVHKIGILDIRLFNTDRHAGIVLLSTKGSEMNTFLMTPIDHGMCLPSFEHLNGACFDWMSWPQSRLPFSSSENHHIA
ncbi:hypothetical protein ABG067_000074 [Albugo candida]